MWFSDKPRPQQYLTKELGELFLDIPSLEFEKFTLAFWLIITKEWSGIDHHRLDKFLLLVRRALFFQLKRLKVEEFDAETVKVYLDNLAKCPLSGDQRIPHGIPFHLMDIYCDELEKVIFEDLETEEDDDEEKDEEDLKKKQKKIIEQIPLKQLFDPFVALSINSKYKPLRTKIKGEMFDDGRLEEWGIQLKEKKQEKKQKKKQVEESEDEEDNDEDEDEDEDQYEDADEDANEDDESDEDGWKGFD
jgi:ribosomal RNA-processing protein 1